MSIYDLLIPIFLVLRNKHENQTTKQKTLRRMMENKEKKEKHVNPKTCQWEKCHNNMSYYQIGDYIIDTNLTQELQENKINPNIFLGTNPGKHTAKRYALKLWNMTPPYLGGHNVNDIRCTIDNEYTIMTELRRCPLIAKVETPRIEVAQFYGFAMPCYDEGDVFSLMVEKQGLTEESAAPIIWDVCCAIDYMSKLGIAHRDIKPENFMTTIKPDGSYGSILIDFGYSTHYNEDGMIDDLGTLNYKAPEIFAHQRYFPNVDVWSLGVSLYTVLFYQYPFHGDKYDEFVLKENVMNINYEFPYSISQEGQDIIMQMLQPPQSRISLNDLMIHDWFDRFLPNREIPAEIEIFDEPENPWPESPEIL